MPDHDNRADLHVDRQTGMTGGAYAIVAVAVMLGLGLLVYVIKDDERTASTKPPATTGQSALPNKNPLQPPP
jgi:hypothetical protein